MFTLGEITNLVGGELIGENSEVTGISTDTRTIKKGEVFFALRGKNFDGHSFITTALEKGACACVIEKMPPYQTVGRFIVVKDVLKALGDLSAGWRRRLKARVIAVTGTNGKTTTKDMITHILVKNGYKVSKAQRSFNNFIGLPLTLLGTDSLTDFVVLEIGISQKGEMKRLAEIAVPYIGVITNVSPAHLEGLDSVEEIAKEKALLLSCIRDDGFAVLNADNNWTSNIAKDYKGKLLTFGSASNADIKLTSCICDKDYLLVNINDVYEFKLNLLGYWNIYNALAAVTVSKILKIPPQQSVKMLSDFNLPPMRMEKTQLVGITFINDAYNSNPISAKLSVEEFSRMKWTGRKVAVIGDMLELGKDSQMFHKELGRVISKLETIDAIILVGKEVYSIFDMLDNEKERYYFPDTDVVKDNIKGILRKNDLVLLKGSRAIGLERLLEVFK
jgi:UDP-N-acetylmuramoyl-tripeptide--D-alanyl-D-alanine ligase